MSAETLDDYKTVIADLKARRARLDTLIAGLEQEMLGGSDSAPTEQAGIESRSDLRPEPTEIRLDTFFGLSIPDAIRKCFRISKRPLSLSELTNSLKGGGMLTTATNLMATVSATLQRMKQQSGEVVALGKGQWGLAEWYPCLRKEKIEATAQPKKARGRRRSKGAKKQNTKPGMKKEGDDLKLEERSKPTAEQIEQIRRLSVAGKKPGEIAKEVGMHHLAVWSLLKPKKAA
jgi:DNA-directed RNA polymerase delta subunit